MDCLLAILWLVYDVFITKKDISRRRNHTCMVQKRKSIILLDFNWRRRRTSLLHVAAQMTIAPICAIRDMDLLAARHRLAHVFRRSQVMRAFRAAGVRQMMRGLKQPDTARREPGADCRCMKRTAPVLKPLAACSPSRQRRIVVL